MSKEIVDVPFQDMRVLIEKEDNIKYTDYEEVDLKGISETVSQEIEIVPLEKIREIINNEYEVV